MVCPYCQSENTIEVSAEAVEELDYLAALSNIRPEDQSESLTVHCEACGATQSLPKNVTADRCQFCGSPLTAQTQSTRLVKPQSLLPFKITGKQAGEAFVKWIASLWFAPSELKKLADAQAINGAYIPYWTYDSDTRSDYTGERGDDYWDTEHYTETENGKTVHKTRQVRKTRWHSVSGRVHNEFDDILILASKSLPRKITEKLEPWDLNNLVPFDENFLAGFVVEAYQINLPQGFDLARVIMDEKIRQTICGDIGGDHQRIHSVDTHFGKITYKHLLLPLWISAYRYHDKSYRFLVNARTGEVGGERPYSFWKIFFLVLVILAVVGIVILIANANSSGFR